VVPVSRTGTAYTLDLGEPAQIAPLIEHLRPALILNAAAYTFVDRAEAEPERAFALNATAVGILGETAERAGVPLIHYSTDYVFNGHSPVPYAEDEACDPVNVYGQSKRAGEEALLASAAASLILRTSWVYASRGQNFLRTVLRLAGQDKPLRIVDDQHGAPTWAHSIALATALIVRHVGFDPRDYADCRGIYHLTNAGDTTWCGFAREILQRAPPSLALATREVMPITTADYPTPARRPRYSRLAGGKLRTRFDIQPEAWDLALAWCLDELA
jgi:dTDP-4-dehydrorhamnose reductase